MTQGEWLSLGLLACDWCVRLVLCVRVIMRRSPVPVSLAWLLVLLLIPGGWLLYGLIGENRLGARRAARHEAMTRRIEEEAVARWRRLGWAGTPDDLLFRPLARLGTIISGIPPLRGNALELAGTGGAMLDRLIADIDAAAHHCHLLFYIWMPASKGAGVGEALIRAASRGVACRVLVDDVGSRPFLRSDLCARMRGAGVKVAAALPANPVRILLARIDLRNHRKIAVIDGLVAYTGSQNLTDETFRVPRRKHIGPWIDATVRVRGPAVEALQTVFLRDWALDSDEEVMPDASLFPELRELPGTSWVHVIPSGPGPQVESLHHAMLSMLFAAGEEVLMTTPYFVPDEAMKAALQNAALRGVDVSLVLPDRLDARVVAAASRSHYEDLLVCGVKVRHHLDGLLHAKTACIDRRLGMVGSANFDTRSFWLNFECTLFVYDPDFAGQLRFMIQHLGEESQRVYLDEWRKRPRLRVFADNVAQLFSPLL